MSQRLCGIKLTQQLILSKYQDRFSFSFILIIYQEDISITRYSNISPANVN